ncbi:MAG TPA: hypothetical protein ENH03_01180 [Candidatus Bathyarchaeota archaeon]|nr:hypothetical protein [Candidatus Bathyarchaeota archaeon]
MIIILLDLGYPLHGFLHSFIGGTLAAIALTMVRVRGRFNHILSIFKIEQGAQPGRFWLHPYWGFIFAYSWIHVCIQMLSPSTLSPLTPSLAGVYWWA